jgi:hypothetical protein
MNPYDGYKGAQREAKSRAQHIREAQWLPSHPPGPCAICGDPEVPLEPHSQDYSLPCPWSPPAEYALCSLCHVHRLHARFRNPQPWEAHKARVRRGGYSSDLKIPEIAAELAAFRAALKRNEGNTLQVLRSRASTGDEWWEDLLTDQSQLADRAARPRP